MYLSLLILFSKFKFGSILFLTLNIFLLSDNIFQISRNNRKFYYIIETRLLDLFPISYIGFLSQIFSLQNLQVSDITIYVIPTKFLHPHNEEDNGNRKFIWLNAVIFKLEKGRSQYVITLRWKVVIILLMLNQFFWVGYLINRKLWTQQFFFPAMG